MPLATVTEPKLEPLADSLVEPALEDATVRRIEKVAAELHATLGPLVEQLAGTPPRPVRLTRSNPGPGLDKSLASRLVQATKAASDLQFMHLVPSPTGLRMLLERAQFYADPTLISRTERAVEQFQQLLDSLPGGRQALDACMGESQSSIREKREQIARQASFKAVSFLFGHYCETLATALFLFPSATPGRVDMVEVHRRVGLRRLTASAQLPLLSLYGLRHDPVTDDHAMIMADIGGDVRAHEASDFIILDGSSTPLPTVEVERDDKLSTFLLAAGNVDMTPLKVTTAFRMMRAESLEQREAYNIVRVYMLHTPCRNLVRDVYLADGLWPDAFPQIAYYLPSPSGAPAVELDPSLPHYRRVNLTTHIEQRPHGGEGFALAGVSDHRAVLEHVLERAGQDPSRFRGWRCENTYPVPLIEMYIAFRFGRNANHAAPALGGR